MVRKSIITRDVLMALERNEEACAKFVDELMYRVADDGDVLGWCAENELTVGATIRWIKADDERKRRYEEAQGICAEVMMHEVVGISDGEGETGRDKLRIETRMKLAGKLLPGKYGERTILSGDEDRPLMPFHDRQALLVETARSMLYLLEGAAKIGEERVVDSVDAAEIKRLESPDA